jgi:hypothetical protein
MEAAQIFHVNGVGDENMAAWYHTEYLLYPNQPVSLIYVRLHRDIRSLVIYSL